jgi:hypothetical protein
MPGPAIETQKVSVIRFKKNSVVPDAHSPIVVLRSVVDEAFRYWARVVPNRSPSARVQRISVVCGGHKHHAPDHHRRYFEITYVAHVKDPLRLQLGDVSRSNFRQPTEAVSGIVAVIGEPIRTGGQSVQIGWPHIDRR